MKLGSVLLTAVLAAGCGDGGGTQPAKPDCLWLGDFEVGKYWGPASECRREATIPPGESTSLAGWLPVAARTPQKFIYFEVLLRKSTNGNMGGGETAAKWLSPYTHQVSELRVFELREGDARYLQGWTEILQTDVGVPGVTVRLSSPPGADVPFIIRVERIRAVLVEPREVQSVAKQLNVPVRGTLFTTMPTDQSEEIQVQ